MPDADTIKLVQQSELKTNLDPRSKLALLLALNSVIAETGEVYVYVDYESQTKKKKKSAKAGRGHVDLPGISPTIHLGRVISVFRKGNNAKNRKDGSVGALRFNIDSVTRGNGIKPSRPTCVIPEGITSFVITGFVPFEEKVRELVPAKEAVV